MKIKASLFKNIYKKYNTRSSSLCTLLIKREQKSRDNNALTTRARAKQIQRVRMDHHRTNEIEHHQMFPSFYPRLSFGKSSAAEVLLGEARTTTRLTNEEEEDEDDIKNKFSLNEDIETLRSFITIQIDTLEKELVDCLQSSFNARSMSTHRYAFSSRKRKTIFYNLMSSCPFVPRKSSIVV